MGLDQAANNQKSYPAKGWTTYTQSVTPGKDKLEGLVTPVTDWKEGDATPSWQPLAGGRGFGIPGGSGSTGTNGSTATNGTDYIGSDICGNGGCKTLQEYCDALRRNGQTDAKCSSTSASASMPAATSGATVAGTGNAGTGNVGTGNEGTGNAGASSAGGSKISKSASTGGKMKCELKKRNRKRSTRSSGLKKRASS